MTDREDFELKISMEYEQPPCLDRDGEGYDNSYVDNAWWGWQAARAIDAKRIAELEAQNKAMREALVKLRDCDFVISLPDRMDSVRDIARLALDKEGE